MIRRRDADRVSPIPRALWAAALQQIDAAEVIRLAEGLADQHEIRLKRLPKAGLAMMRARDSVRGQAFNLGELPMSRAHVEITDSYGATHEGGAHVMQDHEALAVAIAVCDAVLASRLHGWSGVDELVKRGAERIRRQSRVRRAMLERTRVSFSLMNQDDSQGGRAC